MMAAKFTRAWTRYEAPRKDAKALSGVALSHCPGVLAPGVLAPGVLAPGVLAPGVLALGVVIPEFPAWRMADGNELLFSVPDPSGPTRPLFRTTPIPRESAAWLRVESAIFLFSGTHHT